MWSPSVPTAVVTAPRALQAKGPGRRNASIPAVATAVGQDSELQTLSEPPKETWERISATVVGCVVAVGLALWSTGGAWGGRPPHGEDVMAYLVRADFALPHLVAHAAARRLVPALLPRLPGVPVQRPGRGVGDGCRAGRDPRHASTPAR